MHPEQIKAAIRMKGTTPTAIAAKLKVTPTTVWQVIHGKGKSARVENEISAVTQLPVATLWPDQPKPTGLKRRLKTGKAEGARHV